MATITEAYEALRERLRQVKGARTMYELTDLSGPHPLPLSIGTVQNFLGERSSMTLNTMRTIERWIDEELQRQGAQTHAHQKP